MRDTGQSGVDTSTRPQGQGTREALVSALKSSKMLQATPHTKGITTKDPGHKLSGCQVN